MKIRPRNGHVLLKKVEKESAIQGLWLPEQSRTQPTKGQVLAVADDVEDLTVGDYVVYSAFAVIHLKVDDEDLFFINQQQVTAQLEE